MLEKEIWGNSLENWGISILIIIGAFVVAKLVALFFKRVVSNLTKKTNTRLDDIIYESVESPILFGIMLIGIWIAIHRLVYPDGFVRAVDSAYKILIVLNITWLVGRLAGNLLDVYWGSKSHTQRMMPVVKRTLLVLVWIVGLVMALSNVGVNIGALLGTLGIGGIAFALAAQDTVKNIFGAFTILTDKPFSIGDTIRIDNFEGSIVDIGVRSTKMRDYDNRIVTFPNYKIADASIINITVEPMRRVVMKVGLTYDTTAEKMKEAMNLLKDVPSKVQYISPDNVVVNFSDYTDSALVITFIYFIQKEGDIGKATSDVNMEVLTSFNNAGLNFAFPSQTIYIESNNEEEKEEKPAEQPN
ncbi:mechanosensitive ion channel family protein [Prevotella sp. 10(H)]|uniref:mechanosensitive ion channel family protein n=1 Tax=Prevotella sp. 10(H) TaxID=1158294 RepID=UPI0004A74023|nr:mechanosensitive ion channel family protein [Prevotella sp. 10(H)]